MEILPSRICLGLRLINGVDPHGHPQMLSPIWTYAVCLLLYIIYIQGHYRPNIEPLVPKYVQVKQKKGGLNACWARPGPDATPRGV